MSRLALPCLCLSIAGLLAAPAVRAQDVGREMVVPQENVRFDYAQVLDVNPIYQTLRTTRMEPQCPGNGEAPGRLSRMVGAVKDAMASKQDADGQDCRLVPVTRDFRRAIAYDVDYVYKGSKYRTRLGHDPGNRLRVRVSITPQPMASR